MFKQKLFHFFSIYFKNEIHAFVQKQIQVAVNQRHEEKQKRSEFVNLSVYINEPVICISNEWDTPIIGFGLKIDYITQAQQPILVVKNYLDNQEYLIMGKTYFYTEERLKAIYKLNPFELHTLIFNFTTSFNKPKRTLRRSFKEVKRLLTDSGFYQQLNQLEAMNFTLG